MFRQQSIKRLLSLLLLLCLFFGFSVGSCFADTIPDNTSSKSVSFEISDSNSTKVGSIVVYVDALDSYIVDQTYLSELNMAPKTLVPYTTSSGTTLYYITSTSYGGSTLSGYTNWTNKNFNAVYCTPVSVFVKIANTSDSFISMPSEIRMSIDLTMSGNTSSKITDIGYEFEATNISGTDMYTRFAGDYIYMCFGNQYRAFNSNNYYLSPHSISVVNLSINVYHGYYSSASLTASDIMTVVPNNITVRSSDYTNRSLSADIPINNDSYNLQQIENDTETIRSYLSSDQQTQNQISSNITSQTQQQEEQYNEFSANSDSSDSSNINGAISSGTDAVRQKMGLFSFFDGIVTSLSDVLTGEHERHLVLPALDVPLPEETVHIWDRKEFDFDELESQFGALLTVVRFATVAVCYSVMISGAYSIFHKFIGVKDSDA